ARMTSDLRLATCGLRLLPYIRPSLIITRMLRQKVLQTIRKYRMMRPGDRVLVAVSGGPDSIALLHLLLCLQKELGLFLAVAHLDHQMRPDSHSDREFVERLAARLSILCFCDRVDVPALVRGAGGNLEEVAGQRRRAFLEEIAAREKYSKIATGHTLNDQAETVLMKLFRGSGSAGLSGIAPIVGKWIRPMIETRRAEIFNYLNQQGREFREDATNQDTRFLRNRVRHQLIPLLEKHYSPNLLERMSTLAELERETARYWRCRCHRWIKNDQAGLFVPLEPLGRRPIAEQREAIRLFLLLVRGNLRRINFEHTESVRRLMQERSTDKKVVLPGGWEVVKAGGVLRVRRRLPISNDEVRMTNKP
ncbi:MAG TPA: tRNA lysidine(34) synthetase TilS, partial [Acidobacteriota bacterium]|nr:tRNA lysidine(34) synthetase TilS [Acidobacteriota bacterium]